MHKHRAQAHRIYTTCPSPHVWLLYAIASAACPTVVVVEEEEEEDDEDEDDDDDEEEDEGLFAITTAIPQTSILIYPTITTHN